jgi:hypothetical protein
MNDISEERKAEIAQEYYLLCRTKTEEMALKYVSTAYSVTKKQVRAFAKKYGVHET